MGDLLNFPEAPAPDHAATGGAPPCMSLQLDFYPMFDALEPVVRFADAGPDQAAVLTAYLRRAASGVEAIGFFRVEEFPGGLIRLSAHLDPALAGLFQTPKGAA